MGDRMGKVMAGMGKELEQFRQTGSRRQQAQVLTLLPCVVWES